MIVICHQSPRALGRGNGRTARVRLWMVILAHQSPRNFRCVSVRAATMQRLRSVARHLPATRTTSSSTSSLTLNDFLTTAAHQWREIHNATRRTTMPYSLAEAAAATGMNKTSILRAIKS